MHVAVVGAAGMIGRKLVGRLVDDGRLGQTEISRLTLADIVEPDPPAGWDGEATCVGTLSAQEGCFFPTPAHGPAHASTGTV